MVHARQVGGQIFPLSHALGFPGAGGLSHCHRRCPLHHQLGTGLTGMIPMPWDPTAHGNFAVQHSGSIRRHERSLQTSRVCCVSSVHGSTICTVKGVLGWGHTWINALFFFKFDVFFVCTKKGRGELCEERSPFLWCEV